MAFAALATFVAAPVHADNAVHDWTGFYAGLHGGGGWGQEKGTDYSFSPFMNASRQSFGGGFGGAQFGYNVQFGRTVWGSELSASYGNLSKTGECIFDPFFNVGADCKTKIDWSLRLLGRLGYAYGDGRFMPYVVGGAVMSNIRADRSIPGEDWGGARLTPGAALGAGFEYALGNGYSFGLEYLYVRYFNQNYSGFSSCGCEAIVDQNINAQTVRASLNYTFGSPPRQPATSQAASRDATVYDWTGFYVGASGGKNWSEHKGGEIALLYVDRQKFGDGFGGLQLGYNYQVSRFVWGAEFSGSFMGGGSTSDSCYLPGAITCSAKEDWTARLLGRFGYAVGGGEWLPYVTGGIAMTRLKLGWDGGPFFGAYSARANMIGVVFGGGVQYAFRNGWSAGVEYLFTAYGNQDFSSLGGGIFAPFADDANTLKTQTLRFVANYKFGEPGSDARAPGHMFDWSGFYAGVNAGYEKARSSGTDYLLESLTLEKASGASGGFQLGYNHQVGRTVLGAEVSFAAGNVTANSDCSVIPFGPDISCRLKEKWNGRLLAKLGYVSEDGRFLPYLVGGMAIADFDNERALSGGGMFLIGWGSSKIYTGLTGGLGFQYAWTQNLSFGAEYLFTQYGMQKPIFDLGGINGAFTQNARNETFRLVMNYKFAGALGR